MMIQKEVIMPQGISAYLPNIKAYISVYKLRFILLLQYRAAAIAGLSTQFAFGAMRVMALIAFYRSAGTAAMPISLQQSISYIWLTQAFLGIVNLWSKDTEILGLIRTGNVVYELVRPLDIYSYWYFRGIAQRTAPTLLRCVPLLIVVFLLPAGYGLTLPVNWYNAFLFLVSLTLAVFLVSAIMNLMYILSMMLVSMDGLIYLTAIIGELFSGLLMPLQLMPDWVQATVNILPFRGILDTPFRFYIGSMAANGVAPALLHQIIWIVLLVAAGKLILVPIKRRIAVQGG